VVVVSSSRLRADALRNRARILAAARDLFIEQGAEVPLDDIARRAGVGNATLYRRFPDRQALAREVALVVLRAVADEARAALEQETDAFEALARYMHRAIDVRVGAVMSVLAGELATDGEVARARDETAAQIQRLIDAALDRGQLRSDVTFADIGVLLVRLSRPLPGPLPTTVDAALAHRHLDLVLDGLCAVRTGGSVLPGPSLTLGDLRDLTRNDADARTISGEEGGQPR
jgi:AcrR family transcriptional regulator